MATYSGTYIKINTSSSARINALVDDLLTPRLMQFRQINVYDENAVLQLDGVTWQAEYHPWNSTFPMRVHKNGELVSFSSANYTYGTLQVGAINSGDIVNITYNFDYFPVKVLTGYLRQVVDFINTGAIGPPTDYTVETAPSYWDGVMVDLAFALCMERLLLDYDLWYGRLIFAIPNIEEGGDIVGQLETLKSNAEERANKTLDNEKFKVGNHLAPPTTYYWQGIRGGGGGGGGRAGATYARGKLHGWRPNKYI